MGFLQVMWKAREAVARRLDVGVHCVGEPQSANEPRNQAKDAEGSHCAAPKAGRKKASEN
jgi:hypothetical protein